MTRTRSGEGHRSRPGAASFGHPEMTIQSDTREQPQRRQKVLCPHCNDKCKSRRKLEKHLVYYHRMKTEVNRQTGQAANKNNTRRPAAFPGDGQSVDGGVNKQQLVSQEPSQPRHQYSSRRSPTSQYPTYASQPARPFRDSIEIPYSLYDLARTGTKVFGIFFGKILLMNGKDPEWTKHATALWYECFSHGVRQYLRPPSKNDSLLEYLLQLEGSRIAVLEAARRHYPNESLLGCGAGRLASQSMLEFGIHLKKVGQQPQTRRKTRPRPEVNLPRYIRHAEAPRTQVPHLSLAYCRISTVGYHHQPLSSPDTWYQTLDYLHFDYDQAWSCQEEHEEAPLASLEEWSSQYSSPREDLSEPSSYAPSRQSSTSDEWSSSAAPLSNDNCGYSCPPEFNYPGISSATRSASPLNFDYNGGALLDDGLDYEYKQEYQVEDTVGYYEQDECGIGQEWVEEATPGHDSSDEHISDMDDYDEGGDSDGGDFDESDGDYSDGNYSD